MRIHRLDLIKYGKFTSQAVAFPPAARDFHLIVGPNEAGKSTLRASILDLLFGIQVRSALAFQHPLNELRLGAVVGNAAGNMEFHRIKAMKQTLRTPQDAVLADNALAPYLGTVDRVFFDQMFGLDHSRLMKGGNSILSAEDNVGQILFQSAAGIAGLGKMRDALNAEADKLWAPRKSADRAYHVAAEKLDAATTALKNATVRTKVWSEAHLAVEQLIAAQDAEIAHHQQLQVRRNRIERIRRTAPFRSILKTLEADDAGLGDVLLLAPDAAVIHAAAERALATAGQLLELRTVECTHARNALIGLALDDAVLAIAADVTALDECRLQTSAHAHDIARRQSEIDVLWVDICNACSELDWPHESEAGLLQRLPTLLVRRELGQRMREYSGLLQTLDAARAARQAKAGEIDSLTNQLQRVTVAAAPAALRVALSAARALGDAASNSRQQETLVERARVALDNALTALQPWCLAPAELAAMAPPGNQSIVRLVQERQALLADQKIIHKTIAEDRIEMARLDLEIAQFMALHQPAMHDDVLQARKVRDAAWSAIRTGHVAIAQGAVQFEASVARADAISDNRLDQVEEATALQNLIHMRERKQLSQAGSVEAGHQLDRALALFEQQWDAFATGLGLPGMPVEDITEWLGRRSRALEASSTFDEAVRNQATVAQVASKAGALLTTGLGAMQQDVAPRESLAALCLQAETLVSASDAACVRRDTLAAQLQVAQDTAAALQLGVNDATGRLHHWTSAWTTALAKAGLAAFSEVAAVEGALELLAVIEQKLGEIRAIRSERIEMMRVDLQRFATEAHRLADMLEPALREREPAVIAQTLASRLAQARTAHADFTRLQERLDAANAQVTLAQEAIATATASLTPLMARAGVDTHALLAECIVRSDRKRGLQAEIHDAHASLLQGGDGLTRAEIDAEVDAVDLLTVSAELTGINEVLAASVAQQATLSAALANAQRTLAEIEGTSGAAHAESLRQEALAEMSDAAERYIQVCTATRLLRWSIERYRERKQGPMLARASAIFAQLTLGSYQRLVVDFDRVPTTLEGQRPDGKLVGVAGMSDGTRDQLYLALRLAALELHLEQVVPLPFIADDLFINYDDARSTAGLQALATLSQKTQVIFLTHHDHLIGAVQDVFGAQVNIVRLG